ncbi:enolase C-terminal domain-like protein [Consotaella salsifontis]|uniref:L-alanine-DL-glutamate epimerase n=1 Tax=Consotaella salsifontis TaxID=1365950 RepID=A0A1T4TFH5_9HYPH|nr:enolase C-terminal domain-like protein [Consotaella salsifontis]SKA39177.1 L-alanine-DL-glutamate epimerase [Consotaella salsifontis]
MPIIDSRAPIETVGARAFTIPTDAPESDGTLEWKETTLVLASVVAGGKTGIGYSYTDASVVPLIEEKLAPVLKGKDALGIEALWQAMRVEVRNLGQVGLVATAISAVDNALWDLKGKLLGLPVSRLLGEARASIPTYGSGGFTSYDEERLAEQLAGWALDGHFAVKMKVGRDPAADPHRMAVAREAIGAETQLFVDANGALARKEALAFAEKAAEFAVCWFEEPVSSNDLEGLRLLRDRAPTGMAITTGEYGFALWTFWDLLAAGAVDVIQADATRCGGITGFMKVAALAEAHEIPLSSHCAPALHLHPCLAACRAAHMEWFHDHVRIERMLFDGAPTPSHGSVSANGEPGLGLRLKAPER